MISNNKDRYLVLTTLYVNHFVVNLTNNYNIIVPKQNVSNNKINVLFYLLN